MVQRPDITGFASRVIEDVLGDGAVALFLQGCAGDVNPVLYKDVNHPRDANPWGICSGQCLAGVENDTERA